MSTRSSQATLPSELVLALGTLLLATIVRLHGLDQNSLWIDEVASLTTAQHALSKVPAAALAHDAFEPPIYFWLLHLVITQLGDSEKAVRLLSVLAGAFTVPMTWLLVRELTGRPLAGAIAALLLALNPLHLWYSQEARPYALMLLFGVSALWSLLHALRTGSKRGWIGYSVLSALAILCHTVAVVLPGIGVAWTLLERKSWRAPAALILASIGIVVLVSPFLYALATAVREARGTGSPTRLFSGLELPYSVFTYIAGYSFGPAPREIQEMGWQAAVWRHPLESAISAIAMLGLAALIISVRVPGRSLCAVLFAVPLLSVALGSHLTTKAYNVRYTLLALIGLLALAGSTFATLARATRLIGTLSLVMLFLWADVQWFGNPLYWKEDSRAALACVGRVLPPGSSVAVAPGYLWDVLKHYARRGGLPLNVDSVSSAESLVRRDLPHALLISRPQHLPDGDALVRVFYARAARPVLHGSVLGYQIYVLKQGTQTLPSAQLCAPNK